MKKRTQIISIIAVLVMLTIVSPHYVSAAKKSITLNKTKVTLSVGKTATLKVKKVSGLKSKAVTFKSNKSKVASVNSKGKITAKKKGTAIITVTSKANRKVKTTVKVTVNPKQQDYNSAVTEKKVRECLNIPKDAEIKITYADEPGYKESFGKWRIWTEVTGKGKYKGYSAGAFFDVDTGEYTDNMIVWQKQ